MPTVVRVIWRFDHDVSSDYLDNFGSTLKALSGSTEGFWQAASVGTLPLSQVAEFRSNDLYRRVSIEQNNFSGWIEWTSGIKIENILKTTDFLNITRILTSVLAIIKIERFHRAGIRFIMLNEGAAIENKTPWIKDNVNVKIFDLINNSLGGITDLAYIFEGCDADMLFYRVSFGPNDKSSMERLLGGSFSADAVAALEKHPLIFDLDLFENAIGTAGFSFAKWASTKLEKAQRFVEAWPEGPPVEHS